jgi:tetratricopeptide (TPR) repeat protein
LEDTLPYLFALLGIEEQPSPLQQMDPQIRRKRTFDALKKLFLRESLNQPLILIFEDLHWIDGETQGLLDVLSESVASAKVLLLVNYRPEYRHEWGQKTYYTQLRLAPFGKTEAEEFLDALLSDSSVGATGRSPLQALKQLILEKTEGTPFFMEEVVQELLEQDILVRDVVGARRAVPFSQDLHIPTTVQGVLAARIDRLAPDEKVLLQQLAVIGREFPLNLIRQVVPQTEDDLYRLLASLQRKEFLYEQPALPEVEYTFKHALTQEVAYNSVLQERRKALHEQTAQALENLHSANIDEHYRELAHHYSRSGNTQKAVAYLYLAGQQATQRSANAEATTYLTTALALLQTLADIPARIQQELTLQLALGPALMATKGYAAPEVETAYARARALCQQVGETPQLVSALGGLWVFYLVRGDLQTAQGLAEQALHLAQRGQDPALRVGAHYALGQTLFFLGEMAAARDHLEQGIALYSPRQEYFPAFLAGQEPGVVTLSHATLALWALGYPDQARKRSHEALALAQELAHPFSLAFALSFAAMLYQFLREGQSVQEWAGAGMTLSRQQGFPVLVGIGHYLPGLGADGAGTERGRDGADAPGAGCLAGHGGRTTAPVFSYLTGRGVWESGAGRGRTDRPR